MARNGMFAAAGALALGLIVGLGSPVVSATSHEGPEGETKPAARAGTDGAGIDAETGTDPRDFAPKFMPYYRYTELENGLEQNEAVLFGLFAFTSTFAMTYEIPVAMDRDVSDTSLRNPNFGQPDEPKCAGVLEGGGSPTLPNGTPVEGDCEETGFGDMNLRFMYRTKWDFLGADWLIGAQFDLPTANEDELGSETFAVAPLVAPVWNLDFWPGPGAFAALMNFYFIDAWKDSQRDDINMYVGRWFFMLPLRAPGPGIFDGIYLLPEAQPIYDFDDDEFSFWIAPEIGKILAPGVITYLKPGWGVDPDEGNGDRDFTFEFGFRYFMK
ncbi:MAG: hypothetical protein JSV45_08270 [Chromatiales bacterium]|nr:MAG: hypothetical protein JSV45_08270 [Chromatiales bacterium]